MTNDQDQKKRILYDQLLSATINQLEGYVTGERGTLDDLKIRCREFLSKLTIEEQEEIDTVQKLLLFLDKQGAIGPDDVWLIKILAEKLHLPELMKEVEEYEAESFSAARKAAGYIWETFKGLNNRTDDAATTTPPEILVRSPQALNAYKEAIIRGKTKNRRVLVTVVGPSRAGKTSLLKTLKGEEFDPEEDSTTGVVLQKAFCKPQEDSWFEEDNDEDDLSKNRIVECIAQKLENNKNVK